MTSTTTHSIRISLLASALLCTLIVIPSVRAATPPISVSYLSASAVYLDAGRAEGLAVGSRLRVLRGGESVAELEVDYVAEHSASCKVVSSTRAIQAGDRAELLSAPFPPAETPSPAPPPSPEPEVVRPAPIYQPQTIGRGADRTKTVGSIALGYRTFSDDLGPSVNESIGRVSLRLTNIGSLPLELRVRGRARDISRSGFGPSVEKSQRSDRLYDLSLRYAPPEGRFAVQLGRLSTGPYAALGYLDGALGEVRFAPELWFGLFAGSSPDVTDLKLDTKSRKYGGFFRFDHEGEPGGGFAEVVVGGVTERDDQGDPSRDFVTLETRVGSGSRWYLFQRAEIDLNRGWRKEVSGKSSQISNAAISTSFRFTPSLRGSLSYDQNRNYLTADTRPVPEEVFTRFFREGARASVDWSTPGGWNGSLGAGQERADDLDKATDSAFLSLSKNQTFGIPLLLGGDASSYRGGVAEGWVGNLRARWVFRAGHDIGLTIGAASAKFKLQPGIPDRKSQWARLSGTVQLPARLWLYAEYEIDQGDDLEGSRGALDIGYRF
jgi:hypothetical protein